MRIVLFYHSLVSDWNHGNAHFLRGIVRELKSRGHSVEVFEPRNGWSRLNLIQDQGSEYLGEFQSAYPGLTSTEYDLDTLDLNRALRGADLVIVHEWNAPELVRRVGLARREQGFVLLFHDTHHRLATQPEEISKFDLSGYDGVLAYGRELSRLYLLQGLCKRAWVWHEAADIATFRPLNGETRKGDLVWIGNWGDDERSAEIVEYLIEPVKHLGINATVYGVRYPAEAIHLLKQAGVEYKGWLPNYRVPEVFSSYKVTLHISRRPYVESLRGIPTIRPFEAMACGLPLIMSPWHDEENLFTQGKDYLTARDGDEMRQQLKRVLGDSELSDSLSRHGLETIKNRHSCAHRVDELLNIYNEIHRQWLADVAPAATMNALFARPY